ncbi:MAG: hypothetical protein JKY54_07340 [Flavobacteriales bacterium]|nr:hypothetical protein [Flavobacteriales bacterium]
MANKNPDRSAIKKYQTKISEEKKASVINAVKHSLAESELVTVAGIARKAGVSRVFICNEPGLKALIDDNRHISEIKKNASLGKARESARLKNLENKLETVITKSKRQALKIKDLEADNLKLKHYIEHLAAKN